MKTKLATELPRHREYPRLVTVPADHAHNPTNTPRRMVRLTSGRFISTARWNELAGVCADAKEQFRTAKAEADAVEAQDRRDYAALLRRLAHTESAVYDDPSLLESRQLAVAEWNAR